MWDCKEGDSYIVEWNESEEAVKRNYQRFQKRSLGVVQFDTTRNRFLAAGDDFSIKFWNMDNVQLLTTIDADGGLPACPHICFNKDGTLLAVSTYENGIKILANSDGIQLLQASEYVSYNASRTSEMATKPAINPISAVATSATIARIADKVSSVVAIAGMKGDNINLEDVKPGLSEETNAKSKKLTDITEPSQFQSFKLYENVKLTKVEGKACLSKEAKSGLEFLKCKRLQRMKSETLTGTAFVTYMMSRSGGDALRVSASCGVRLHGNVDSFSRISGASDGKDIFSKRKVDKFDTADLEWTD